jgi:sortase (surface protein transpeptidase)
VYAAQHVFNKAELVAKPKKTSTRRSANTKRTLGQKSTRPVRVLNSRTRVTLTIVIKKPAFKKAKKRAKKLLKQLRKQNLKDNLITGGLILVAVACATYLVTTQFGPYLFARSQTRTTTLPVSTQLKSELSLPRSDPVRLVIPAIELNTELIALGKNQDGTLEVPARTDIAGWYKHAPTPGEVGPAIIAGHLNNYTSWDGVFSKLSHVTPGDIIDISRSDGKTVQFTVDRLEQVSQLDFPTKAIYGDINYPGLRLITCGGSYNYLAGGYSENTVVFATMVDPIKQ